MKGISKKLLSALLALTTFVSQVSPTLAIENDRPTVQDTSDSVDETEPDAAEEVAVPEDDPQTVPPSENADDSIPVTTNEAGDAEKTPAKEETQQDPPTADVPAPQTQYVLYITHVLQIGNQKFVRQDEGIVLNESDFANGGYDVLLHAVQKDGLDYSSRTGSVQINSFYDGAAEGTKECYVSINYSLKDGYTAKLKDGTPIKEGDSKLRSVLVGDFDEVIIKPAESVMITIHYEFSQTGGLAGVKAHDDDRISLVADEEHGVNLDWTLPDLNSDQLKGFNVVLNPDPLNEWFADGSYDEYKDGKVPTETEFNEAWEKARTVTKDGISFVYNDKTNKLTASGITSNIELTVYYRRKMATYTVKHWYLKDGVLDIDTTDPDQWTEQKDQEKTKNGRAGQLTKAEAIPEKERTGWSPLPFSQQPIAADGSTVINIYYQSIETIRVVFNSGVTSASRQLVGPTGSIDLNKIDEAALSTAKQGYKFAGWQYRQTADNEQGYTLVDLPEGTDKLVPISSLHNPAYEESSEATGVKVLWLEPKWEPDNASVRVIYWIEDLDGVHDYQMTQGSTTEGAISTNNAYSNVGSFVIDKDDDGNELKSDDSLLLNGNTLTYDQLRIQDQIESEFDQMMGKTTRGNSKSSFYSVDKVTTTQENSATENNVAPDSSTIVNVYYKRNVYTLNFYYSRVNSNRTQICLNTNNISQGLGVNGASWSYVDTNSVNLIPASVQIQAKYQADIRDVWPNGKAFITVRANPNDSTTTYVDTTFVSWATTAGEYNAQYRVDKKEATLMGVFSSMTEDIIANPSNPETAHDLYAYWHADNSYYRYNHCFEIPGMTAVPRDAIKLAHQAGTTPDNDRDYIYLVQKADFAKEYQSYIQELLSMNENGEATESGAYIALRQYNGKVYGIARQVNAVSSNMIERQNPSARQHLIRVSDTPDHSTLYPSNQGNTSPTANGEARNPFPSNATGAVSSDPYDLYYYYNRDTYTITYMIDASTEVGKKTAVYEQDLNESYLPELTSGQTNADNDETFWTNTEYEGPLCPNRNEKGNRPWTFKGWSLQPTGSVLDWGDKPVSASSNIRLYAQWEAPDYTVEFDLNGGTVVGNDSLLKQSISGNTSVYESGTIPQPLRQGYLLTGWKVVEVGTGSGDAITMQSWSEDVKNESGVEETFEFTQHIYRDLKVQAQWRRVNLNTVGYTVRYITKENGKDIQIADDLVVTDGGVVGSTVYVNSKSGGLHKGYENYVPVQQNASIILDEDAEKNILTIEYKAPETKAYTINFVERDTSTGNPGDTVLKVENTAAGSYEQLYPTKENIDALNEKGYILVDSEGKIVNNAADLAQAPKNPLTSNAADNVVTFYVVPGIFSIKYWNDIGNETKDTSRYPDSYKTNEIPTDGIEIPNLPNVTINNVVYTFQGWKLGEKTSIPGNTSTDPIIGLKIDQQSRGNLELVAQWDPELLMVEFKPGDHGTIDENEQTVFENIPQNSVLNSVPNFAAPKLTVDANFAFIGWKADDGSDTIYSNEDVSTYTIGNKDVVFTAQYEELRSNLEITKSADKTQVKPGEELTYTITVTNTGTKDAQNVVITDSIPKGTTYKQNSASDDISPVDGKLTWTVNVDHGQSVTKLFTVIVNKDVTGKIRNIASVQDPEKEDPTSTDPVETDTINLKVEKSANPDSIAPGGQINYTLTVTNTGSVDAEGVVLTDSIPRGTTFVSADDDIQPAGNVLTWNLGTVTPNTPVTKHFVVSVDPQTRGTITNTAIVTSDGEDIPSNETTTTVEDKTDVSVTKSVDGPEVAKPGDELTYTLTATNSGNAPATFTITDTVPEGTELVRAENNIVPVNGVLTWNIENLPGGGTITRSFTVRVLDTVEQKITNVAYWNEEGEEPTPTNPVETNTINLKVEKSATPESVAPGEQINYTLTITNTGSVDAEDVVLTDSIPEGTTFESADDDIEPEEGVLSWSLDVAAGSEIVKHFMVKVNDGYDEDIRNTAKITYEGKDIPSEEVITEVTKAPNLVVEKSARVEGTEIVDTKLGAHPGDIVEYTITVRNSGNADAANITVTDAVNEHLIVDESSIDSGVLENGVISWTIDTLGYGENNTRTFTFKAQIDPDLTTGEYTLTNVAVAVVGDDEKSSNEVVVEVPPRPDVVIEKKLNNASKVVHPGEEVSYTLTVTNQGTERAENVIITDQLPAILTLVSAEDSTVENGIVSWNIGTLQSGDTREVTLTARVKDDAEPGSTIENIGKVEFTNPNDPDDPKTNEDENKEGEVEGFYAHFYADQNGVFKDQSTYFKDPTSRHKEQTLNDVQIPEVTANEGYEFIGWKEIDRPMMAQVFAEAVDRILGRAVDPAFLGDDDIRQKDHSAGRDLYFVAQYRAEPVVPVVGADISTQKKAYINDVENASTAKAGDKIRYEITVKNNGDRDALNVRVEDKLQDGLILDKDSIDNNGVLNENTIVWTLDTIAPGETKTVSFTVETPKVAEDTTWRNVAITSYEEDGDEKDPSESDPVEIDQDADAQIKVTKSVNVEGKDDLKVKVGDRVHYTIKVENQSEKTAAKDVIVHDALQSGWKLVEAEGSTEKDNTLFWNLGDIAPKETKIIEFVVEITSESDHGSWKNIAYASYENNENNTTDPDGNPVRQEIPAEAEEIVMEVLPEAKEPNVVISKSQHSKTVKNVVEAAAGDEITYEITVENRGTAEAKNVVVKDEIPALLIIQKSSISDKGVLNDRTITWTIDQLKPNESKVLRVVVKVPERNRKTQWINTAIVTVDSNEETAKKASTQPLVYVQRSKSSANTAATTQAKVWLCLAGTAASAIGVLTIAERKRRKK